MLKAGSHNIAQRLPWASRGCSVCSPSSHTPPSFVSLEFPHASSKSLDISFVQTVAPPILNFSPGSIPSLQLEMHIWPMHVLFYRQNAFAVCKKKNASSRPYLLALDHSMSLKAGWWELNLDCIITHTFNTTLDINWSTPRTTMVY